MPETTVSPPETKQVSAQFWFFFTVPKKEKCFRDEPASADCEAQMACCVM